MFLSTCLCDWRILNGVEQRHLLDFRSVRVSGFPGSYYCGVRALDTGVITQMGCSGAVRFQRCSRSGDVWRRCG